MSRRATARFDIDSTEVNDAGYGCRGAPAAVASIMRCSAASVWFRRGARSSQRVGSISRIRGVRHFSAAVDG